MPNQESTTTKATETPATEKKRRFRHTRKAGLLKVLVINLLVVSVPLAIYYFSVVRSRADALNQRSFRALNEIKQYAENQLDVLRRLQDISKDYSKENLLTRQKDSARTEALLRKLIITDRGAESNCDAALGANNEIGFCGAKWSARIALPKLFEGLQERLHFDELIVADDTGKVLGQLQRRTPMPYQLPLHDEIAPESPFIQLAPLITQTALQWRLQQLASNGNRGLPDSVFAKAIESKDDELGSLTRATQTIQEIGAQRYHVYIQPVRFSISDASANGKVTQSGKVFSLVGLFRESSMQRAINKLGPAESLVAVIGLLLLLFSWPILRLMFLEPNDSLSQWHPALLFFSICALIGILSIGYLTWCDYKKIASLAQARAKSIANTMQDAFISELSTTLKIVTEFQGVIDQKGASWTLDPEKIPVAGFNAASARIRTRLAAEMKSGWPWTEMTMFGRDRAKFVVQRPIPPIPANSMQECQNAITLAGWSENASLPRQATTLLATNSEGCLEGPLLRFVGTLPLRASTSLADREYFSTLATGRWMQKDKVRFVIQRLRNKADGKQTTQIAVPRGPGFAGIATMDWDFASLRSAVLPFGFKYAIFDETRGTVLFHSDATRELVENFPVEVGSHSKLMNLIALHRRGGFSSDYYGVEHDFEYLPMQHVPWGLVVFRPSAGLRTVVMSSAVGALIALFAYLFCYSLALLALSRVKPGLTVLWPQWRLRNLYPALCVVMSALNLAAAARYVGATTDTTPTIAQLLSLALYGLACWMLTCTPINTRRFKVARMTSWALFAVSIVLNLYVQLPDLSSAWAVVYGALLSGVTAWVVYARWRGRSIRLSDRPWRQHGWMSLGRRIENPRYFHLGYVSALLLTCVLIAGWPAAWLYQHASEMQFKGALRLSAVEALQDMRARSLLWNDPAPTPDAKDEAKSGQLELFRQGVHGFDSDSVLEFKLSDEWNCKHEGNNAREQRRGWLSEVWSVIPYLPTLDGGRMVDDLESADGSWCMKSEGGDQYLASGFLSPGDMLWKPKEFQNDLDRIAMDGSGTIGIAFAALLAVLLVVVSGLAIKRTMGTGLPFSGQDPTRHDKREASKVRNGIAERWMLIKATAEERKRLCDGDGVGKSVRIDLVHSPKSSCNMDQIFSDASTAIIENLDVAVLDSSRREVALEVIERACERDAMKVVLLVDSAVLRRVLRPSDFPGVPSGERLTESVNLRFARALMQFHKSYGVLPDTARKGATVAGDPVLRDLLERETRAFWPDLKPLREMLMAKPLIDARKEALTEDDLVDEILNQATPLFCARWLQCTREERLAMYQLADGRLVNAANEQVVAQLLRRGVVCAEPEPRLKSVAFSKFVMTAEPPENYEKWIEEAAEGVWQTIRTPLLILVMLFIAWIAYSADELFQALSAVLASTLLFFGNLMRASGFFRGSAEKG